MSALRWLWHRLRDHEVRPTSDVPTGARKFWTCLTCGGQWERRYLLPGEPTDGHRAA